MTSIYSEPRQDSTAEIKIAQQLGLERVLKRNSDHDAFDENGNRIEIKSTTKNDFSVSMGRNFGPSTIAKYRNLDALIIGFGQRPGFELIRSFFLGQIHYEPWMLKREAKIAADQPLADEVLQCLRSSGRFSDKDLEKHELWMKRGRLENDPQMPRKYIEEHAIEVTSPADFRRLMQQFPRLG